MKPGQLARIKIGHVEGFRKAPYYLLDEDSRSCTPTPLLNEGDIVTILDPSCVDDDGSKGLYLHKIICRDMIGYINDSLVEELP